VLPKVKSNHFHSGNKPQQQDKQTTRTHLPNSQVPSKLFHSTKQINSYINLVQYST